MSRTRYAVLIMKKENHSQYGQHFKCKFDTALSLRCFTNKNGFMISYEMTQLGFDNSKLIEIEVL